MTTAARHVLEPGPIRGLALDKHHRRIPWFVHVDGDGVPDFRVMRAQAMVDAVQKELCWICGTRRGNDTVFPIGSMCAVNRVAPEPPSHRMCAIYSAKACPFLSTPGMRRRPRGLEEVTSDFHLTRNPGVVAIWHTRRWQTFRDPKGIPLWRVGEPTKVLWFREGRAAAREEVMRSIDTGLPALRETALQQGQQAVDELEAQLAAAMKYLPKATA